MDFARSRAVIPTESERIVRFARFLLNCHIFIGSLFAILFKLFIPIVDYWAIYDNTERHRKKVATGYLGKKDIFDTELFNTIQGYVR